MRNTEKCLIMEILPIIILLLSFMPMTGHATLKDTEIQKKLTQKYEQNANELISLIQQEKFEDVEAFINYVFKNDHVTRDGIQYFRALLGYWFYAPERITPFPVDILSHLNKWIEQHQKSAIAHIIRGTFYIDYAWEARGRGWAKDVKKEAWNIFYERMTSAQEDLAKAYELDPQNPHSSRQLMRIAMPGDRSQEIEEALFQQVIAHAPTFYWAYRAKLNGLMPKWGGTWKAMFQFARDTEKNAPPKTLLPLILVHAHEEAAARSGNKKGYYSVPAVWNDIERVYEQIMTDFPDSERWKTEFGTIAYNAGKIELAKQYWKMAVESDPYYFKTYEAIAWLYEEEQQWELEEKYARRLVELYPQYAKGYSLLGYALIMQQRYLEAVKSYSSAIQYNSKAVLYWRNRCYCYNEIQEYEKAIEDCTKALELNENEAGAYQSRGYAYEQLGNTKAAEADYRKYEKLSQK